MRCSLARIPITVRALGERVASPPPLWRLLSAPPKPSEQTFELTRVLITFGSEIQLLSRLPLSFGQARRAGP